MNKTLKDMLIGVLLGDAHIGRTGLNKAFISFEQSNKKSEYLNYLYKLTKEGGLPLMEDGIKEYTREDNRFNNINKSLYFRTQSLEELKPLADLFLNEEGKKIIPSNIGDHLTEKSLAFWIMDDGQQVKRGGLTLCTDNYKHEEEILRNVLKENFNLNSSIHNKKSNNNDSVYERIYLSKQSFENLKPSLIPHMHETMLYKINEDKAIIQDTSNIVDDNSEPMDIFVE